MKARILIAALLAISAHSSFAASAAACAGTAAVLPIAAVSTSFIQVPFSITCSNNVNLAWIADTTAEAAVCANSKKGKNNFGGSTNGKAPVAIGTACTGGSGTCTPPTAVIAVGCT